MVDDEAVGRGPTTAPAPLRVSRAMGARGGRPHSRVDGDRVSRAIGGVLRSTREEGARLRVPPRGRGAGDDQWCSPPSSRAPPLPPLGESAVAGEVSLLVVIPPSPRFALPGLDAGVVGQPVTRLLRFAPPGRHGPGAEAGEAARSGPAAAPPPLSEPARPPAPTASHCGPRHHSPNSNRSRASLRAGASQEPPPRQGTHPHPGAPNPRDRRVTREHVT